MDIQQIRTLTTGLLHTKIDHVYSTIEYLTNTEGIMPHHIPSAMTALKPFLQQRIQDQRFWDNQYDPSHTGTIEITPLTEEEMQIFWGNFDEEQKKLFKSV